MTTFVIGSEKGGPGKTTLATNLAVYLARKGKDVILPDVDSQGSAFKCMGRRAKSQIADLPAVQSVTGDGDVARMLRDLNRRYDYSIVDAGGRNTLEFRSALRAADVLVIPVRPAAFDLETLPRTAELVTAAQEWNENLRVFVLINQASTNPQVREVDAARAYIAKKVPSFQLVPTVLHDRKAYRDASLTGLSVLETQNRAAATEMEAVANYLFNL